MKTKKYKKICIVFAIIFFVLIFTMLTIYMIQRISVSSKLNLTQEQKSEIDYNELINNIIILKNTGIIYSYHSVNYNGENWTWEYYGDGYSFVRSVGIEAVIPACEYYYFYVGNTKIYTVITQRQTTGIFYVFSLITILSIITLIIEIIFIIIYKIKKRKE